MRTTTIIKALGSDKLTLYKGSGYFYFTYDDPANNVYETHSVDAVCRLTDLTLDQWISEGKTLLNKIQEQQQ